jgi:hypothetical protein
MLFFFFFFQDGKGWIPAEIGALFVVHTSVECLDYYSVMDLDEKGMYVY